MSPGVCSVLSKPFSNLVNPGSVLEQAHLHVPGPRQPHGLRLCPEGPASSGCQPILPFLPKAFLWLQPSPGLQDSRQEPLADEKPISRGHGVPTLPPWPPLGHSTAPAPWEILPLPLLDPGRVWGAGSWGVPSLSPHPSRVFLFLCVPLCVHPLLHPGLSLSFQHRIPSCPVTASGAAVLARAGLPLPEPLRAPELRNRPFLGSDPRNATGNTPGISPGMPLGMLPRNTQLSSLSHHAQGGSDKRISSLRDPAGNGVGSCSMPGSCWKEIQPHRGVKIPGSTICAAPPASNIQHCRAGSIP